MDLRSNNQAAICNAWTKFKKHIDTHSHLVNVSYIRDKLIIYNMLELEGSVVKTWFKIGFIFYFFVNGLYI